MKFTVFFKQGTVYEYGAKLLMQIPFLAKTGKSVPIRLASSDDRKTIEKAEIFVSHKSVSQIPKFFIGELQMLSPQIDKVERA